MSADEMFEELGYFLDDESYWYESLKGFHNWNDNEIVMYIKKDVFNKIKNKTTGKLEDCFVMMAIVFDIKKHKFIKKCIDYPDSTVWINIQELQAINKKVEELGWLNE